MDDPLFTTISVNGRLFRVPVGENSTADDVNAGINTIAGGKLGDIDIDGLEIERSKNSNLFVAKFKVFAGAIQYIDREDRNKMFSRRLGCKIDYGDRNGAISISCESEDSLEECIYSVFSIIEQVATSLPVTHFVSLPLAGGAQFNKFAKEKMKSENLEFEDELLTPPNKLHLTLTTLHLYTKRQALKAVDVFNDCIKELPFVEPPMLQISGVHTFADANLSKARVLFAKPASKHLDILLNLFSLFQSRYEEANLTIRITAPPVLHVTLMKSVNAKSWGKKRSTVFNAMNIVKNLRNYDFGSQILYSVQLSQRFVAPGLESVETFVDDDYGYQYLAVKYF